MIQVPRSQSEASSKSLRRVKYIRDIDKIPNIPPKEREKLKKVAQRYVFRVNDYYL